jgi:ABC-type Na+ efflux pump permease subunit
LNARGEDALFSLTPILKRELLVAARRGRIVASRAVLVGFFLAIVLAIFTTWYYSSGLVASRRLMSAVAWESFLTILLFHFGLVPYRLAAESIAGERDRRTLDFLLGTRLSSAEIILGKLAACLMQFVMYAAAALPLVLLLHVLGGVDIRMIALAYAALLCLAFLLSAFSIWISLGAPDARRALSYAFIGGVCWIIIPMQVAFVLPGTGVWVPALVKTINAWVLASSPLGLILKFVGGVNKQAALVSAAAQMCGLQVAAGAVFVILTIIRLRSSSRASASNDRKGMLHFLIRPGWRFLPRRPVSDDAILWREMTTVRASLLSRAIGSVILGGVYCGLVYLVWFFMRPALFELWHHGYAAVTTNAAPLDLNWFTRFYMPDYGPNPPVDIARTEFNLVLRSISIPLVFLLTLCCVGVSAEAIVTERTRLTWDSLIATSLSAREILRSKLLAAIWRLCALGVTTLVLWTLGLVAGAIHPLGCLTAVLITCAFCWMYLTLGLLSSVKAPDLARATNPSFTLYFVLTGSIALIFLLPARFNSVLWGAGAAPFVTNLSLFSYRDVPTNVFYEPAPFMQWLPIIRGEGAIPVALACLAAVVLPGLAGFGFWRYGVAHFDRLIGRPWKNPAGSTPQPRVALPSVNLAQLPSTVEAA